MLAKLWIFLLFCLTYGSCANLTKSFQEVNGTIIGNRTFSPQVGPYLVTSELVVAHNATLTIEAGSEVVFVPTVGLRVHGSLHAKGTHSNRITFRALPCNKTVLCNNTDLDRFYNPGIRLVGGTSHSNGRLEIQWNGQWGTVCDYWNSWDYSETAVACRQLGFLGAKRYYTYPGSGPVHMRDVYCNGQEETLWNCGYKLSSCYHSYDVGIECDTLMPLLIETVYWNGIYFAPTNFTEKQGNSSLENADIVNAFEGIKALKKVPDLLNVTIRDGASGLLVKELENHLAIMDTNILRSALAGANIESSGGHVVVENSTVQNTSFGDGFVYNRILDAMDLCSIVPDEASIPFALKATGKAFMVNCSKIFRARPGRTLSVHFRSIAGGEFELNITDGSAHNNTLLIKITDEYNGKVVKTASSSVLEFSFYSKGNSRVPANLEMIIVEDQGSAPSLLISNSTFYNNFKSGVEVYDLMGSCQISNTVASKNGGVGLHISGAHGRLHVISSVLSDNQNHGAHINNMSGSVVLETVASSKNQESGIVIESGILYFLMTDSDANENLVQGLYISNPLDSSISVSNTKFLRNSGGQGIYFKDFREDCQILLFDIISIGNSQNGALFENVKAKSFNVTSSSFDGNTLHGVFVKQVFTGSLNFQESSTSYNLKTGMVVSQGISSMNIKSWYSIGNEIDGFYLENQEGKLMLQDCYFYGNKGNGLGLVDSFNARLQSAHLKNCSVLKSSRYGILLNLMFEFQQGAEDYAVTVANSTIANNALGGCWFYPSSCRRPDSYLLHRRVQLSFTGNKVEGNQNFGLYIHGPEWYELTAVLANNEIKNNSGYALKVAYYNLYCDDDYSFPVHVKVVSSTFINNIGEYTVFVNYNVLPTKRHIVFSNNSFIENRVIQSFSGSFVRTKTQAVLAVKEGTITVEHNSFVNPLFPREMATLLKDHERVIQARENWWGSRDECKVEERIFHFADRIELAQIQHYPFLDSFHSSNVKVHNGTRRSCFLQGNKLRGLLNQTVTLPKDSDTYQVVGDVIVLPNGVLTIEENVSLEFPLKAVFIVFGQVLIKGTIGKRVKLIPKKPLQKEIRLVGSPNPWTGILEIWFNNRWLPVCLTRYHYESTIACRQLGYEAMSYSYRYSSGNETFLHNVRCDTDESASVMHCNRNNWIASSSCSSYVAYIRCKTPYWSGVHLTITPKKSDIRNVDIDYAGFAYRDDLSISGIALRVDLNKHNISDVLVNNSVGIGVQMMYPDPFKVSPDIMSSTITNIEESGILLESPFLNLATTNIVNTKGYGFRYYYNWNPLNNHVFKIADTSVKKNINLCSGNNTFIDDSTVVYYLVVRTKSRHACKKVITVPPDYSVGMQLIHHDMRGYSEFHVYSGTNKTSSTLWDVHTLSWQSRPVWKTSSSSVLFESSDNYYDYFSTVHFVLFLIKEMDKTNQWLTTPNLIISKSNFISNANGGVYLGGEHTGHVQIHSSVVQDSPANGLTTRFSQVKTLNLFNCSFIGNQYGIVLFSFAGNVTIENTDILNSTSNALYIVSDGEKTIHFLNISVIHTDGFGIYLKGNYEDARLFATNSFFGWNKATSIYSDIRYNRNIPGRTLASFKNCTFLMNQGPVVNIDESPKFFPWEFEGNIFMNNTHNSVIMTTQYTHSSYSPGLFIRRNKFLFNVFQEKGVIYVRGGTKELIIDGNVFEGNYGRSVFVEEQSFFQAPATIQNNVFKDNSNSNGGVIEIRRMEHDVLILDNVFEWNEGVNVVRLHNENYVLPPKKLTFTNNSLLNNSNACTFGCEVDISGLKEFKVISIHHNRFNSKSFSKELCVNITANSHTSIVNVSLNFWGYDDENQIKERIYDAEDNYEKALAVFIPFFSSTGVLMQGSNQSDGFQTFAKRYLGGRISSSFNLWSKLSPYIVISDITVLPDAELTIHPGVELKFSNGVGMLILGALFVLGNRNNPVTFSLLKRSQTEISIPVRLVEGTFPWQGHLEVLHNGNWTPVCVNESMPFGSNNAKVICGQLGYQAPSSVSYEVHPSTSVRSLGAILNCNGNEAEINECPLSFLNLSRNATRQVALNCKGGTPWGNLRFLREFRNISYPTTSKLQHLKIKHCGEKHGKKVAAIEMIQNIPEMKHVSILNCTAGGAKVLFPEREVYMREMFLVNTGGYGGAMLITKRNFTLEKVTSMNNTRGLSFHELDGHWVEGVSYGQVFLCDPAASNVIIKDRDLFLHAFPPSVRYLNLLLQCHLEVKTVGDAGFALQLLVMKNVRSITIDNPNRKTILKFSSRDIGPLSRRRLIPWNVITIYFEGWYSSEVLLHIQRVELKDMPCTFERSNCGWRQYPGNHFRNVKLTSQWRLYDYYYKPDGIPDHTYLYSGRTGNYMWLGHRWIYGSYGAFSSPVISKESNYCSLEFYYRLWGGRNELVSLSVFIEHSNENGTTPLWSTSEILTYWKKKTIKLPQTHYNYSVVFLGYFHTMSSVLVDDMEFVRCNLSHVFTHRITESIISGNTEQGISYTSTQTKNHLLRIERCKITKNGGTSSGAIHLNAANQVFELFNNYLAENRNGSIYSRVHYEESESNMPMNHIHGNTFDSNRGRSLVLEGITGPYLNVKVTNNYFSRNFAKDPDGKVNSVCNITNLRAHVQGNFFYNNVGQYAFEYSYARGNATVLYFLNNTLYKNSALGLKVNYGVTILCNGAAEIHGNVLENPGNRYQISTTLQGIQVTVNATSNWWGESVANSIASLIMDKSKDYRLSLTVIFQPFVQSPPQRVISVSCPPEWIKDNELCFLYKGGSFRFVEAKTYCQSYGGNIIAMFSDEDKRLVEDLRREESRITAALPPSLWTIQRDFLSESNKDNGVCSVLDSHGNITESQCDGLHPFLCVRRPVIHCPNGCFHNGDCIGAICFCYPGWTGEDCSRFHCHDLHNCSGNGECMGPNACKCYPGYLGLGCTYSFCEKYESCSDCVTDPFCGWCDSSHSCLGGFALGPPKRKCPDWFYYHCYTVGIKSRCSSNIPTVDCGGKQCNFRDGRGTTESCQKCQDLDKCYKSAQEEGECRSWNETRCPDGQVSVDYTDQERSENVELAENVKFVEANATVIYACPVIMAQQKETSLVFVAPNFLHVQAGDILCSPQAGGIMHKIVAETSDGPFRVMMSAPAGLEEVIKYADFKKEATVEDVDDDSTLEDEPDEEDLEDIFSGNIRLNVSRILVLPNVYKCLGHTYEIENFLVHSYYLVIEKNLTLPKIGDIVASNVSGGFIETVVSVHKTNDTGYLETKLQRCSEYSQLNATRLKQSRRRLSQAVFCSGGDNNPGLVLSAVEKSADHFAVNDSIVGRPSRGYMAKVVKVNSNGDFHLLEVISTELNGNGTFVTAVDVNRLQSHRRRTRRSSKEIDLASFKSRIRHKMLATGNAQIQVSMSAYLSLTAFVEIESKWLGFGIKDATAGLKLEGGLDFSCGITVHGELRYTGDLLVMKNKQLGSTKYIRLGVIKLPAGIFLGMTGQAAAAVSGTLRRSVSVSGRVSLGGECSWSEGSCYTTDNSITFGSDWSKPTPKLKTGAKIDVTVTPTISVKVPAMPKRFKNGAKRSSLNILDKIVVAAADKLDLSLSLYASVPLKAGISMTYPSSQCRGKTPAEIEGSYGISDLIFGVSVGFLKKQLRLSLNTGFSLKKWIRDCICPVSSLKICVGSSSKPPAPRPPIENPPKPPDKKKKRKKKTENGSNQGKNPGLECGEDYACAGQRMGPNCTQPDMYPNQECSGNGKPVILPQCKAECECFGGWEGEYCERISANGGGDPHLETLDGTNFDFFGIGEFWGCKSVQNDFGLQFRFYFYERASLIGGVALKAGKSIVTVMTIKTENAQDTPILRIDGMLINITSNSSKPIDINNGTVLLDRQRRFTFEAEENSVALISMQYDTGVTVTIDVRHSRVMKRQYLNVLYSPTAAYKGHTEGLCGFMDNNSTNDFMGPDGVLYNDAVQFAESWRIKACHNGSGRLDSWFWNSSNFYNEDVMDVTYTDPSYLPVYSLNGIPNSLLEVATSMCKSLNISDNDLHSCIFDVAITNDTTFTDQETFKRDCPSQCSGKGRCVNGTCRCIEGWTGESCDKGSCLNCSIAHGKCVKGFCVCHLGWEGRSCELKADCHNVNNCTSPVHGVCKTTDVCQCSPGYISLDCSVIPTCSNVSNCTGNGLCVDYDVCKCNAGWTGTNCTQYSCEHLDYCSEHGRCVALDECTCDYGWTGASCALPDCSAVNQCSGKGECVASNLCRCYTGFLGASCSEVADCSEFANCSGRGVCVSTELLNVSCSCYAGFTGANCSQPTCTTVNNCSNHGACIDAEFCKCDLGYNGTDCSNFSCEAVNSCSGNGECVGYDICRCNNSWSGSACSVPDCSSVNNCSAQGDCILPDTCACYPAFDGKYCDQKAKPNANSPRFDRLFYNSTVMENSPVGTMIVQVHANDTDMGRNGQVFYTVVSNKEFDDRLAIGGTSGKLYSTSMLDFETIKKPSFNVAIVASDDGFPQKSGVTIVQITVVDENDNCPTFIEPSGNLQLEFSVLNPGDTVTKVSAVDLDSGLNSDITYSMSKSGAFSIDPKTGVITVTSNVTSGLYHLTVSASDNGDVSCKTEASLTVKIMGVPTKEPLTSPASSSTQKIPETLTTQRDTESTSMSTELTEPKVQFTSTAPGDEVTAAPQKSPNYVIIGASAGGGVLMLVIIAVIIRKCLRKTRTSSAKQPRNIGRVNDCLEGDLELSNMTGKL